MLVALFVVTLISAIQIKTTTGTMDALMGTPSLCPSVSHCVCKWSNGKQDASCEDKNLHTIPMQLPPDTQVLGLNGNNFVQLDNHIFQERRLTNLQKLFLSECKITFIADETFAQLTNLIELDLSNNGLQQVPSKAFEPLRHSLRKLSLAHNHIHVVESSAFNYLTHLASLDLSNNQLVRLKPSAFQGLTELRDLKLNENRLSQLPMNVIADLREFVNVELYANSWHCDCELRASIEWMHKHHTQVSVSPTCATPAKHKDIRWQNVKPEEFMCPPVIINRQNELTVGAGSNVTFACSARGSPPLTFVWFQDEKTLSGHGNANNQSEPPPTTKLLEEKRFEIEEDQSMPNVTSSILSLTNLTLTDTSLFLCWVENAAGAALGNFSLTVDDSPPAHVTSVGGGSAIVSSADSSAGFFSTVSGAFARYIGTDDQSTGAQVASAIIGILAILLVLVLIAIILLLIKRLGYSRSTKANSIKARHASSMNSKLSSAGKFDQINISGKSVNSVGNHRMFASGDDMLDINDRCEQMSEMSSGSQSSCRKNNTSSSKMIAVDNLDGFIEHMRSGIINMDYHSMSPVIAFNKTNQQQYQQSNSGMLQQQLRQQQQFEQRQLTQMNHFASASNASSQIAPNGTYSHQPSNGSNSVATTLSDLSPSSGSASTSFANTGVPCGNVCWRLAPHPNTGWQCACCPRPPQQAHNHQMQHSYGPDSVTGHHQQVNMMPNVYQLTHQAAPAMHQADIAQEYPFEPFLNSDRQSIDDEQAHEKQLYVHSSGPYFVE